jgi:Domain of unknown function (DUF6766)
VIARADVRGDFVEAALENWDSEFLQMGMYVVLTAYLFQNGSSESKPIATRRRLRGGHTATGLRRRRHLVS